MKKTSLVFTYLFFNNSEYIIIHSFLLQSIEYYFMFSINAV